MNEEENLRKIPVDSVSLEGQLMVPPEAFGLVLFAHGTGSSRLSPRNNFVAEKLRKRGLGTLLFDLLTEEEDRRYENRFDIPLITRRIEEATRWVREQDQAKGLPIGYFGASTGSAAALKAAADRSAGPIAAVVSRGGRPDMVLADLPRVKAPTLLIVGGKDVQVQELNRRAYDVLPVEKRLEIVPGAGHLFEEPGALEQVSELAAEWLERHLGSRG
jgi:alpha-beta hydrolase superfamily lysophospholipase